VVTGYDAKYYHDISAIAQALNRIANCMEAEEKRKRRMESGGWAPVREPEDFYLEGECSSSLCTSPVVVLIVGAFLAGYWVCLFATWNRVFQQEAKIRKLSNDIAEMEARGDPIPMEWVHAQLAYMAARDYR
jgi:hypothetical protein